MVKFRPILHQSRGVLEPKHFLRGLCPLGPSLGGVGGWGLRVLPPDPPALLGMLRLLIACFACRFNQFYLLLGSCLLIFISFFDFVTLLYHGTVFCIMALILSTVSLLLELVDSFQCIYTMSQWDRAAHLVT